MKKSVILFAFICAAIVSTGWACSVPVYRYALERWAPDTYRISVVHSQPLSEGQQILVDELDGLAHYWSSPVKLTLLGPEVERPKHVKAWMDEQPAIPDPAIVVQYPVEMGIKEPFYMTDLSQAGIETIVQSPVRQKLADRILQNVSTVWLFIPGPDEAEAARARATIKTSIAELEKTLELPEQFLREVQVEDLSFMHIRFEMLEFDRAKDPLLWQTFAELNPKIAEATESMVIPVFGRGRAMTVMLGETIQPEYLRDAASYITASCSCEIKAGNPGFDLLIPIAWDEFISGEYVVDQLIPPLSGVSAAFSPDEQTMPTGEEEVPVETNVAAPVEVPEQTSQSPLLITMITVGAAVILVGLLTWALGRKSESI